MVSDAEHAAAMRRWLNGEREFREFGEFEAAVGRAIALLERQAKEDARRSNGPWTQAEHNAFNHL